FTCASRSTREGAIEIFVEAVMTTADFTDDLIALIEPLARKFFGKPNDNAVPRNKRGKELRFGSNGSMKIDLAKGTWYDFEDKEGGGVLDLVKREMLLTNTRECFEWLEREGLLNGQRDNAKKLLVASFDYPDRDGVLRFVVERFEFRKPDGSFV